jgi:hypothetical protein
MRSKGSKKAMNNIPKRGFLNMAKDNPKDIIKAIIKKGVNLKKNKDITETVIIEIIERIIVFKSKFFILFSTWL